MKVRLLLGVFAAALALGKVNSQTIVEVLFVVDDYTWDKWTEVSTRAGNDNYAELYSMIAEVNLVMTKELGVEIRITSDNVVKFTGDTLADTVIDAENDIVNSYDAIEYFQYYVVNFLSDLDFDAAVMFVGHTMGDRYGDDGIRGLAYTGEICTSLNVAIVEGIFSYNTVYNLIHEIGHLLGSSHDGEGNDCVAEEGWIMTASHSTDNAHMYEFSQCSKDSINALLASSSASCLYEISGSDVYASERFGRIVDGDETCRRFQGSDDSFGLQYWTAGVDICQEMWCTRDYLGLTAHDTPQGLPCGPGQSCNFGRCTDDSTVPDDVDPNCLFGDSPNVNALASNYATCADVVAAGACDADGLEGDICCESCGEAVVIG